MLNNSALVYINIHKLPKFLLENKNIFTSLFSGISNDYLGYWDEKLKLPGNSYTVFYCDNLKITSINILLNNIGNIAQ